MALTAMTWRRMANQTPSGVGITLYLDAIAAAFAATSYTDGTSRTAGTGRAWSRTVVGAPTEALVLTPPTGSGTASRLILAGFSGARTPKMAGPDTYLADSLLAGVGPIGGTLTTWDGSGANDPLGAGNRWLGYTRASASLAAATSQRVACYECAEAVGVFLRTGTSWFGVLLGALWDPDSTDALDGETDGRLYGHLTSGSTAIPASMTSATAWPNHGTAVANAHHQVAQPGVTTLRACGSTGDPPAHGADDLRLPSGTAMLAPVVVAETSARAVMGSLRGIRRGPQARMGQTMQQGATHIGYFIGGSDTATQPGLYLAYS